MSSGEQALSVVTAAIYAVGVVYGYGEMLVGWSNVRLWIYAHETLTGGLLAVAAASLGAWFLYQQTRQSDRHERERRRSRREATKAVLPLALSSIVRYAQASGIATKALLDQLPTNDEDDPPPRNSLSLLPPPVVPADSIAVLREMAEALTPEEVRPFAILLADIQVQASRLNDAIANIGTNSIVLRINLADYVVDAAMIYARVESLFPFGRGASDVVPADIRWGNVQDALFHFDHIFEDDDRYVPIFDLIRRRSEGDLNRIVEDRWTARARP